MADKKKISIRPVPHPYRAMLALCSDLDETPDGETYFDIVRFLNSRGRTPFGEGADLEVGNSIYFDMPAEQFSYWNTNDKYRSMLRACITSGHIDCLHSFGDLAATRFHAERALNELERSGCRLSVWVDHAVAPTNFGHDIMKGHGDDPSHPAYHADLSFKHGIKYVWRGRVTSVIGQNAPLSLGGILNARHPLKSADTLLREMLKRALGKAGNTKYLLHASNDIMRRVTLLDNTQVYEFMRCNPHWGGVSCGDRGDRIDQVITKSFLDRMEKRGASCILYTHLGKSRYRPFFHERVVSAFRLLSEYHHSGRILVTTTRRLLDYELLIDRLNAALETNSEKTPDETLFANTVEQCVRETGCRVHGLTFELPEGWSGERIRGSGCFSNLTIKSIEIDGRVSLATEWPRLKLPDIG